MTRTELVGKISQATALQKIPAAAARQKASSEILDLLLDTIREALAAGDTVVLRDFGTFLPRNKAARTGRNPHTGDAVQIPARTVPAFRPARAFRDELNA